MGACRHRPALANRHRGTWYSTIHRKYYEIDWVLLRRNQFSTLVRMTLRTDWGESESAYGSN